MGLYTENSFGLKQHILFSSIAAGVCPITFVIFDV